MLEINKSPIIHLQVHDLYPPDKSILCDITYGARMVICASCSAIKEQISSYLNTVQFQLACRFEHDLQSLQVRPVVMSLMILTSSRIHLDYHDVTHYPWQIVIAAGNVTKRNGMNQIYKHQGIVKLQIYRLKSLTLLMSLYWL